MEIEKSCDEISAPIQTDFTQNSNSSNKTSKIEKSKPLETHKYEVLHNWYQENRKNQTISLMLNRITKNKKISSEFYNRPLLKLLEWICDTLMMDELEISLWAIYLDNIIWGKAASYCKKEIWFTCYAAKSSLSNDIEIYEKIIVEIIPNFYRYYEEWHDQHRSDFTVSPMSINEKFNDLSRITKCNQSNILNYNYYVDNILDPPVNPKISKKRVGGKQGDFLKSKKKTKLSENKEEITFEQDFVEKPIKYVKNDKKETKLLSRNEEDDSSSIHTATPISIDEREEKYAMWKMDKFFKGEIKANDIVIEDSSSEDWSVIFI